MICYDLKCEKNHIFNSWFNCVDAYDKLEKSNLLSCAVCGSSNVHRAIMAPQVSRSNTKESSPLIGEVSSAEQKMSKIRSKLEAEVENVGENFANEARAMQTRVQRPVTNVHESTFKKITRRPPGAFRDTPGLF